MTTPRMSYEQKLTTPGDLVRRFRPGNVVCLGVWYGEPYGVIKAINEHCKDARDLTIISGIATAPAPYMRYPGINVWSEFQGPQERQANAVADNVFFTPLNYCDGQRMVELGRHIDYFVYRVGAINERGRCNCSMTAGAEYRIIQWLAKNRPSTSIIFEVNGRLPYVHGVAMHGNNELPIDIADWIVEDDSPLFQFAVPLPDNVEQRIARNVANLVRDRDTVQLGFGTLPMAIGRLLADRHELGIHTEMFCEAHIDLIEAGAVTNVHKGAYDGISVASFGLGTTRLHDWMRDNRDVAILPIEETNRPDVLARISNVTSINSILSIDMSGQTTAHCIGPRTYSGVGGAFEFAYGAQLSPGGQSIVCLPSTTTLKDGQTVSNIVAQFPRGARITMPEHIIDWVVTEYGAVRLKFLAIEERAGALLRITHPDFRDALERDIRDAGVRLAKNERVPPIPPRTLLPADSG